MVDLILLLFAISMFIGGWYAHRHFGSLQGVKTWIVSKFDKTDS